LLWGRGAGQWLSIGHLSSGKYLLMIHEIMFLKSNATQVLLFENSDVLEKLLFRRQFLLSCHETEGV
jgi:hypothetical protein